MKYAGQVQWDVPNVLHSPSAKFIEMSGREAKISGSDQNFPIITADAAQYSSTLEENNRKLLWW